MDLVNDLIISYNFRRKPLKTAKTLYEQVCITVGCVPPASGLGVFVHGSLCLGSLCPGWSLSRGSLSRRGVSVKGVSVHWEGSVQRGLCPGGVSIHQGDSGPLPRSLCQGVFVQEWRPLRPVPNN